MIKLNIATNVKAYRKRKKITQEELAKRLGINRVGISHIEKAKNIPSLKIYYLAKELGMTVEELLEKNEMIF